MIFAKYYYYALSAYGTVLRPLNEHTYNFSHEQILELNTFKTVGIRTLRLPEPTYPIAPCFVALSSDSVRYDVSLTTSLRETHIRFLQNYYVYTLLREERVLHATIGQYLHATIGQYLIIHTYKTSRN